MRTILTLTALLVLSACASGCAGFRELVNCDNAAKAKEAAEATIAAIDHACAVPPGASAPPPADAAPAAPESKPQ